MSFFNFGGDDDSQNNQNQNNQNNHQNQNNFDDENNNQNNNQANNQNNNQNNDENNKSIWDNNDNNQNQNDNQNQNLLSNDEASEALRKHIKGLNLSNGIDGQKIQSDLAEGNFESLNDAFETIASNSFQATMQAANKLMDKKIGEAVDRAVQESGSKISTDMATQQMTARLPFTQDKDIFPVAKAALQQFLDKGENIESAVKKVDNYFKATAKAINGGGDQQPGSGRFNQGNNYSGENNNNQSNANSDWEDILTQN